MLLRNPDVVFTPGRYWDRKRNDTRQDTSFKILNVEDTADLTDHMDRTDIPEIWDQAEIDSEDTPVMDGGTY